MPLDTGAVASFDALSAAGYARAPAEFVPIILNPEGNVGQALREVREARMLSLDQVSAATRVRPVHLAAIENFDFSALPSRPFAIGYVRAYAQALRLDAEAVVARFKAEAPDVDKDLQAPIGVRHQTQRRFGSLAAIVLVLALAVIGWNIVRHAMSKVGDEEETPRDVAVAVQPKPQEGPAQLGAPLPAPPEASTPDPYVTPGLATDGADAAAPAAPAKPVANTGNVGQPFVAGGQVYGQGGSPVGLILKATKPTVLVVHNAAGQVYFARQLAAGEAWRAPAVKGLSVDVGNPASVEAYVGGFSKGVLTQPTTPLSALGN